MDKGILRAKPSSVFFVSEEEKRSFCLNRVKPLKLPQPRTSVQVNLVLSLSLSLSLSRERERERISFFEREHPFIDKLMFITEQAVARTPPLRLGSKLYPGNIPRMLNRALTRFILDSCGVFLEYAKIKQAKTNALLTEWRKGTK